LKDALTNYISNVTKILINNKLYLVSLYVFFSFQDFNAGAAATAARAQLAAS
jgi:hypothetical protein